MTMDIQLHHVEAGQGQPLILLHGNGENSAYFEQQITCFSKSYRVLAIDTHEANVIMRKGLERHGYQYCGIIHLLNGDERMAFQFNQYSQ